MGKQFPCSLTFMTQMSYSIKGYQEITFYIP